MILKDNLLTKFQNQFVMVDGCFDPLHIGHIYYFKFASNFKKPVFCNIENDSYIKNNKKRPPLIQQSQRLKIIDSIKYIQYVHLQKTTTADVLGVLKPVIYIKGADWSKNKLPKEETDICSKYGIKIIYLKKNLDSSNRILESFITKINKK